jgi:sulfatase maturation enzyme AslB (radical SAM superfamily)
MTEPTRGCCLWKKICSDGCLAVDISEHGMDLHLKDFLKMYLKFLSALSKIGFTSGRQRKV